MGLKSKALLFGLVLFWPALTQPITINIGKAIKKLFSSVI